MERISREELIEDFQAVASELEKVPTLSEYSQYGSYSSTPIYKRFDSFENLKETAGFETGEKNSMKRSCSLISGGWQLTSEELRL